MAYNPLRAYRVLREIQMSPIFAVFPPTAVSSAGTAATAVFGMVGAGAGLAYRGELTETAKSVLEEIGKPERPEEGRLTSGGKKEKETRKELTTLVAPDRRRHHPARTRIISIDETEVEPERTPVRRCASTPRPLSLFPYPEEKEVPLLPGIHEPRVICTPKKTSFLH